MRDLAIEALKTELRRQEHRANEAVGRRDMEAYQTHLGLMFAAWDALCDRAAELAMGEPDVVPSD